MTQRWQDQISQAVKTIAEQRTRGEYSDRIAKATSSTGAYVNRLVSKADATAAQGHTGSGLAAGLGPEQRRRPRPRPQVGEVLMV
jgi:hypothetical protein